MDKQRKRRHLAEVTLSLANYYEGVVEIKAEDVKGKLIVAVKARPGDTVEKVVKKMKP